MSTRDRLLTSLLTALALAAPVAVAGCATHSVYDDDYRDYHHWNGNENVFYIRWESETHRDHRDFDRRSDQERREYWQWRHHDHDHDHN
jgi:hypothetical protein